MYLMCVDESGDSGLLNSPTNHFVLSGLILHELRWQTILGEFIAFRRTLRQKKGLKLREEIHASNFISKPGELVRIQRNDRIDILRQTLNWIASHGDLNIITVVVNKNGKTGDVFELAWERLIQRFENTLRNRNFSGPVNPDDKGMIISDNTDGKKLVQIVRKMHHFNPVPNIRSMYGGGFRNVNLQYVIEDPFMKDSASSYFHQMVDIVAYFARQLYSPNAYIKKKGMKNDYNRLMPNVVKKASPTHPLGIVEC